MFPSILGSPSRSIPLSTFVFWAVSTLIFLLTVTWGFWFRTGVKFILNAQATARGVRAAKTKPVSGALALKPVALRFPVSFSYGLSKQNGRKMVYAALPKESVSLTIRLARWEMKLQSRPCAGQIGLVLIWMRGSIPRIPNFPESAWRIHRPSCASNRPPASGRFDNQGNDRGHLCTAARLWRWSQPLVGCACISIGAGDKEADD